MLFSDCIMENIEYYRTNKLPIPFEFIEGNKRIS